MKPEKTTLPMIAIVIAITAAFAFAQMMGGHNMKNDEQQNMPMKGMMDSNMMSSGTMGSGMMSQEMMGMMSQCKGGMHGKSFGALFDLGLSDKQIETLIDQHAGLMKQKFSSTRERAELESELAELRKSSDPDTKRLRTVIQEIGNIDADLEVQNINARKQARKVFSDEQLEKLGDRPLPLFAGHQMDCGMMSGGMMDGGMMDGGMMGCSMMGGEAQSSHSGHGGSQ